MQHTFVCTSGGKLPIDKGQSTHKGTPNMLKIDATKKYALAVSGGVDSMVMLHSFANHLPRPDFYVVTVNHNIRKEGASDCKFVENYCKQLGVECYTFDIDVPAHAKLNKLSLETSARLLRYQIFDNLNCDYICTAHHERDQAETVLMHIIRGSGLVGAQGMRKYNGRYFRPLLNITKQHIESYAQKHNVPFVVDQTNTDDKYLRNYIRNNVLPLLQDVCPSVEQNIARFAQNVANDQEFLDGLADVSTVQFAQDSAKIPLELLQQPQPIAYRIIKKTLEQLGVHHDVESKHYQAICQLTNKAGGKQVHLPFDYVAINDYTCITICKVEQKACTEWEIPFAIGVTETPVGKVEITENHTPNTLHFDIDAIPSTAVFRTRRTGDVFVKFGGCKKSLKEYLIDKKIPQRERDNLLLIADGQNVLAIVGVEISAKIKAKKGSKVHYINKI
ncbi:MAG: tRNA lysidine(34) synthetase TilS [Clostridia bacterium]|nr:tRNA lysidine(34) synthetase TilS [Clostridia bacterium]